MEHTGGHSRTKSGKKAEGHKTEQHKRKTNKIKQEVTKDRITNGEDDLARNGEHRERSINEIRALIQTNKCQEYNPANHDIKHRHINYHSKEKPEIPNTNENTA